MIDPEFDFSEAFQVSGRQLLGGSGRLRRAQFLAAKIDSRSLYYLQDGSLAQRLLIEISETYISGQFLATIVLGFSFVERTIAARLHFNGKAQEAKGSSEELLTHAVQNRWLSAEEKVALDDLRKVRNPIVHFRDPLNEHRPEVRAILKARTTAQHLEEQAKLMVESVVHLINATAL